MSLGQELAPHLPFLRRYARALTGSQAHGDAFVRATLEAIVAEPDEFPRDVDPRLGLYRTFHAIWSTANIEEGEEPSRSFSGSEGIAHARLSRITPLSRQALLLTSLEGFSSEDAGYLIGASPEDVESLVSEALSEIDRSLQRCILEHVRRRGCPALADGADDSHADVVAFTRGRDLAAGEPRVATPVARDRDASLVSFRHSDDLVRDRLRLLG